MSDATKISINGYGDVFITFGNRHGDSGVAITSREARTLRDQLTEALGDGKPTPTPFKENAKFEDVRKGDLVRVEGENGTVTVGVATEFVDLGRIASGGRCQSWDDADEDTLVTAWRSERIAILSRPEPVWEDGDLVLDAAGDAWLFDGDRWSEVAGSCVYSTVELEGHYGPLTRAKVVAAE